jgi:hypothetical protein
VAEFMQAAAARYGQPPFNVKHWEMYNEPDCGDPNYANVGYGFFGHDPQAYVDLLHTVYDAVKAVNTDIQVVLGGLAYDWFEEDGGPFVRDFIDQVLYLGGADYFDFMNLHYYRVFDAEWASYGHGILGKLAVLQEILESNNVEKPFLSTESGWYSDGGGPETEVQARYVVQLFTRILSADLAPMIWYDLVDAADPIYPKFGLLESDMDR